ncbi:RHS repeat-associated core domain-containing protein [Marispirochaeta sp.]|uniref:RHS repeat-associated core domain-containing protein n=1 Tax=Marispirochaeta sp. TaxID=2038653 RepID=UPI0029C7C44D|nr:RHS repeat-associated core domain-containing protein [Marispirochaeta sp.]
MGLTDEHGHQKEEYRYDVWGKEYHKKNGHSYTDLFPTHYGYNGKRFDPKVALIDYGFRDYKPEINRWTTIDPIRSGTNWYAYVGNDPVNWVDPLGLLPEVGGTGQPPNPYADARRMEAIVNLPGEGEIVYAQNDGVVFRSGWQDPNNHDTGMGWRTSINTEDGYYDQDGHLDPESTKSPGTRVHTGDPIGRMADPSNGHTTGPHVHHEQRKFGGGDNNDIDPGVESPFVGDSNITSGYGAQEEGLRTKPHSGVDHVPEGYIPKEGRDEFYGIQRDSQGNVSGL